MADKHSSYYWYNCPMGIFTEHRKLTGHLLKRECCDSSQRVYELKWHLQFCTKAFYTMLPQGKVGYLNGVAESTVSTITKIPCVD